MIKIGATTGGLPLHKLIRSEWFNRRGRRERREREERIEWLWWDWIWDKVGI